MDQMKTPLVQSVITHLETEIAKGSLVLGEAVPTERSLAKDLGVSRGVVRLAIQTLGEKGVLSRMDGCRPVVLKGAPSLDRTNKDHISIWLWPRSNHFFASQILRGIQTSMGSSSLKIVVGHARGSSWREIVESEAALLQSLLDDRSCAGAIVWYVGGTENMPLLQKVGESGVPVVFVDRLPDDVIFGDYVGTDNFGAASAAVNHLIELGHQRIACITNLDHASSVTERIAGWRDALSRAGLPCGDELIFTPDDSASDLSEESYVRQQFYRLFSEPERATAAFCINDTLAVVMMDLLHTSGRKAPDDLSIMGFDGLMSNMPSSGGLSSAVQNFERIGQTAVRLLMDRIANPRRPSRHVLLDAPLHLNGSTSQLNPRSVQAPIGAVQ